MGIMVAHEEVTMEYLNVEDLPEPIVRGLEIIVEMTRTLAGRRFPRHFASA